MADIIQTPIPEPIVQPTPLPAGVSTVLPPGVPPTPAGPAVDANGKPIVAAPTAEINWLKILAGTVIVTGFAFGIYYFRYRTRQYSKAIKSQNSRIAVLEEEVDEMSTPME